MTLLNASVLAVGVQVSEGRGGEGRDFVWVGREEMRAVHAMVVSMVSKALPRTLAKVYFLCFRHLHTGFTCVCVSLFVSVCCMSCNEGERQAVSTFPPFTTPECLDPVECQER